MQYTLWFESSDGSRKHVGRQVYEANSIETVPGEVIDAIIEDVHRHSPKFNIAYTRRWEADDGTIVFDYGSHTRFYILKPTPQT